MGKLLTTSRGPSENPVLRATVTIWWKRQIQTLMLVLTDLLPRRFLQVRGHAAPVTPETRITLSSLFSFLPSVHEWGDYVGP